MSKIFSYFILTATLIGTSLPAIAIDQSLFGGDAKCVSGNCNNGEGTIRINDGTEFTGLWVNGRGTAGVVYKLRDAIQSSRITEVQFNAKGELAKGTKLRNDLFSKKLVGEFTGTFVQTFNPFINRGQSTYHVGKYTDIQTGRIYDGEFSYIPVYIDLNNSSGYFVFQGARIDNENDEVVRGLFVSDEAFPGKAILFHKARPDYLIKLHKEFEASKARALADSNKASANAILLAKAAESERESSENISSLFSIIGGLLAVGGGSDVGVLQSRSLAGLTSALASGGSTDDILQGVVGQVIAHAGGNTSLNTALGGATGVAEVITALSGLGKSNQPMTRAEYEAKYAEEIAASKQQSANTSSDMVDALGTALAVHTMNKTVDAVLGTTGIASTSGLGDLAVGLFKEVAKPKSTSESASQVTTASVPQKVSSIQKLDTNTIASSQTSNGKDGCEWDADKFYNQNQVVSYRGATYTAKQQVPPFRAAGAVMFNPASDTSNWNKGGVCGPPGYVKVLSANCVQGQGEYAADIVTITGVARAGIGDAIVAYTNFTNLSHSNENNFGLSNAESYNISCTGGGFDSRFTSKTTPYYSVCVKTHSDDTETQWKAVHAIKKSTSMVKMESAYASVGHPTHANTFSVGSIVLGLDAVRSEGFPISGNCRELNY